MGAEALSPTACAAYFINFAVIDLYFRCGAVQIRILFQYPAQFGYIDCLHIRIVVDG